MVSRKNAAEPNQHIATDFRSSLAPFDLDTLVKQSDTIFGLDADLRLAFFNPGWFAFAAANGGQPAIDRDWGLGKNVLDACPPVLRSFYRDALAAVLETGQPWEHDYECSSADEARLYHLTAYPLLDRKGLLLVNALVVASPHDAADRPPQPPDAETYRDAKGFIHQCANCRKIRRREGDEAWDWVPAWVTRAPADTSHGLCPPCLDFHYPA